MTPTTAVADKIRATGKPINAIANNAGVPPTTIYSLFNGKCKNIGIYYSDDNKRYQIDELEALEVSNRRIWLDGFYEKISEFGKSLFLSREEAEKALAEMEV